jgi:hypothetical protein
MSTLRECLRPCPDENHEIREGREHSVRSTYLTCVLIPLGRRDCEPPHRGGWPSVALAASLDVEVRDSAYMVQIAKAVTVASRLLWKVVMPIAVAVHMSGLPSVG